VIAGGMAPRDGSLREINPQDRTGVYDLAADRWSCWGYDPATDQWMAGPPMRSSRHGRAAASVNGRIFAVGGGLKVSGGQVCAINEMLLP